MDFPPAPQLAEWELALANRMVKAFLNGRQHINGHYAEDLVQECLVHWLSVRSTYATSRGSSPETFMRRVLQAKLIDFQRAATAQKRGRNESPLSLDKHVGGSEESSPLGDLLPDATASVDELQLDLPIALSRLSQRQRRVVRGLVEGYSVIDLSRVLKVSRDTLHEEVRRIRQIFTDEGLRDHLDK